MHEGAPEESNQEEVDPRALTPEEIAGILDDYLIRHPNPIEVAAEEGEVYEQKIAEFKELVGTFEINHSLSELHSIVDLTPEEALLHESWQAARKDLEPIVALLNTIAEPAKSELKLQYKRLSQAVGIINRGKLDHTR